MSVQAMQSKSAVELDGEGYLVDPADWNPQIAIRLAGEEGLLLTDDHWRVIEYMRRYYDEHQIAADARFTIKFLADELGLGARARNRLFELFPYGYVKQACKISGMKRPRAWSTG